MKRFPSFLIVAVLAFTATQACAPFLGSSKQPQQMGQAADQKKNSEASNVAGSAKGQGLSAKDTLPTEMPIPPLPGKDKTPAPDSGLSSRAEVNQAALDFTDNLRNIDIKAVKTCYSKLYGGWNLYLYVTRNKKIMLLVFQWNPQSKEWEPVRSDRQEIPDNQLKYHIKGEVNDEKCFVLKNLTEK